MTPLAVRAHATQRELLTEPLIRQPKVLQVEQRNDLAGHRYWIVSKRLLSSTWPCAATLSLLSLLSERFPSTQEEEEGSAVVASRKGRTLWGTLRPVEDQGMGNEMAG
ncbi:hypothetical protein NL676_015043 [Syzygium grande]|nr:hypothetical protein NL676_015043 [Syzygium grande]